MQFGARGAFSHIGNVHRSKIAPKLCTGKFLRIYTKLCWFSQFSWFNFQKTLFYIDYLQKSEPTSPRFEPTFGELNQHSRYFKQQNHTFSRRILLLILLAPLFYHVLRDLLLVADRRISSRFAPGAAAAAWASVPCRIERTSAGAWVGCYRVVDNSLLNLVVS